MKKKPKRGRPPLEADQRRNKQLHVLLHADERQYLTDLAKRNSRSVSEEVLRRLRATFANPSWDDPLELQLGNVRAAVRVLVENGWHQDNDVRYGGVVLSAPGTSPPGPFISEEEANAPPPAVVASESMEAFLRAVFSTTNIPVAERRLIREAFFEALAKHVPKKGEKRRGNVVDLKKAAP